MFCEDALSLGSPSLFITVRSECVTLYQWNSLAPVKSHIMEQVVSMD